MKLWRVRDSCGWCLYRVQGCVVIVAIFCPCGDVKPHLRLRIGGSWWVERAVSACVPKDPYARGADTWVSSLEYTVAVVRSLAFQYKIRFPLQARTISQEQILPMTRDGCNDLGVPLSRACTCHLIELARTADPCYSVLYASTMAHPFVFQLRLFVPTRQRCKLQRAVHNVFILPLFQHQDIGG